MATLQQSASGKKDGDIRYLTPLNIETNKAKLYYRQQYHICYYTNEQNHRKSRYKRSKIISK